MVQIATETPRELPKTVNEQLARLIRQFDLSLVMLINSVSEPMEEIEFEKRVDEIQDYLIDRGHRENPHGYVHDFAEGMYYREMTKAPMEFSVGAKHRIDHLCLMMRGRQLLFTHEGVVLLEEGCQFVGLAGSRKVTLTLTEVVFANVFSNPDDCRDIEELERRYACEESLDHMRKREYLNYFRDDMSSGDRIKQLKESGAGGEGHSMPRRMAMLEHALESGEMLEKAKSIVDLNDEDFLREFESEFPIPCTAADHELATIESKRKWIDTVIRMSAKGDRK